MFSLQCFVTNWKSCNLPLEHKWEHTKSTLERVYGDTFDHIFESFDEHPMASGSIAQVHRATLREASRNRRRKDRICSRDSTTRSSRALRCSCLVKV